MNKSKKTTWLLAGAFVLLACLLALSAWLSRPNAPAFGEKTFSLSVIHKDGAKSDHSYTTSEELLGPFLESEGLIAGEDSAYGLFVKTVDGETVSCPAWWNLKIDGADAQTGVDEVPIEDGAAYTWTYMAQ